MCLAIPGIIESLSDTTAVANFGGIKRKVDISLLESPTIGEYILVHVGFAIQKIDEKTAHETYRLLSDVDKEALDEELRQ